MKNLKVSGVIMTCDVPNHNGRIYPRAVVEKAIKEYQKLISSGRAYATVENRNYSYGVQLQDVAGKVTNIKLDSDDVIVDIELLETPAASAIKPLLLDSDDVIVDDIELLETPAASAIKLLLLEKDRVAIRPYGMGTVNTDNTVQDDYILEGITILPNK